ncbi:hypothetical protein DRN72_01840 [Methanosarcinales archaeon]|jgi:hypothetical protein|nr:MAG: hypothetical protein DRN72_01840 [Methanosarcinales archaeon]
MASAMLGRTVRYPESIGERRAIEIAHHIAYSARELLLKLG